MLEMYLLKSSKSKHFYTKWIGLLSCKKKTLGKAQIIMSWLWNYLKGLTETFEVIGGQLWTYLNPHLEHTALFLGLVHTTGFLAPILPFSMLWLSGYLYVCLRHKGRILKLSQEFQTAYTAILKKSHIFLFSFYGDSETTHEPVWLTNNVPSNLHVCEIADCWLSSRTENLCRPQKIQPE